MPRPPASPTFVASPVPLITRADAPHADRAVRGGELVPVARGVFAPAEVWRPLPPWEKYLARVHAAAQSYPDAVFVAESGAALRGLPVFGQPPEVHLLLPHPSKSRALTGIRVHTTERMPEHERIGGIQVATAEEIAVDIARTRHPAVGLAVAGAALRRDPELSADRLSRLSEARPSERGRRHARWVFERASGEPESPLEHVSLAVIEWLGFPTPELQKWFNAPVPGDDDRVDCWWAQWAIAGEADGEVKYSGAFGDARAALRARNARDARLRERGVKAIAHWGWPDVVAYEQLRALLVAVGLHPVRPEQSAPLRSLARALRPQAR